MKITNTDENHLPDSDGIFLFFLKFKKRFPASFLGAGYLYLVPAVCCKTSLSIVINYNRATIIINMHLPRLHAPTTVHMLIVILI